MTLETMDTFSAIVMRRGFGWPKNRMLELNRKRENKVRALAGVPLVS